MDELERSVARGARLGDDAAPRRRARRAGAPHRRGSPGHRRAGGRGVARAGPVNPRYPAVADRAGHRCGIARTRGHIQPRLRGGASRANLGAVGRTTSRTSPWRAGRATCTRLTRWTAATRRQGPCSVSSTLALRAGRSTSRSMRPRGRFAGDLAVGLRPLSGRPISPSGSRMSAGWDRELLRSQRSRCSDTAVCLAASQAGQARLDSPATARTSGDPDLGSDSRPIPQPPPCARYASTISTLGPARLITASRVSALETSSSCSLTYHWRKFVAM